MDIRESYDKTTNCNRLVSLGKASIFLSPVSTFFLLYRSFTQAEFCITEMVLQ